MTPELAHSSPPSNPVLVIGGGIAGVQASLDLAESGAHVLLVERSPSIGGVMAALDKNFPTLDCSICIEAPKLSEVGENPNIEILANSDVVACEGKEGDFTVTINQRPRYVGKECTRCGECANSCPVMLPSEFEVGMGARKAIYAPFPQSVPGAYTIDMSKCLNQPPNYLPCSRCVDACGPKVINFDDKPKTHKRKVSSVIISTGFELINPKAVKEYSYGTHPDIMTSMEFERLLTSAGPTGGEIVRPSTMHHPENMAFILCVGSRDEKRERYCSRFCCMYSLKHVVQALDHGVKNVTVFYMDIRAYGKGFDAFWQRAEEGGAKFIRGRPSKVFSNGKSITVEYEDTKEQKRSSEKFDMVVLATAAKPPAGLDKTAQIMGLTVEADGFITGEGIETARDGIYTAGCTTGPKDIPDSVAEASGAAAAALTHVKNREWIAEEEGKPLDVSGEPKVGVFVCHCGSNIAGTVDVKAVVKAATGFPNVTYAEDVMFACAGNTQNDMAKAIKEKGLNRLVVAACSPKTHEGTFRRVCRKSGLNTYLLEMVNVRNQDSWVHKKEQEKATEKAVDMVRMGVEKARKLYPLVGTEEIVIPRAIVVGGGISGMTAAVNLALQGYETHLVEKEKELGGSMKGLHSLAPSGANAQEIIGAKKKELDLSGVRVHPGTSIETISGSVGNFHVRLSDGVNMDVGAVVLATGAGVYRPTEFGYGTDTHVMTNMDLEAAFLNGTAKDIGESVTLIGCVGSRKGNKGCSRYCCQSMVGQALELRRMGKTVNVLYREMRTFGRNGEEMYAQAQREGVRFFKYSTGRPPEEAITYQGGSLEFKDELLGEKIKLKTDKVVLVVGLTPTEDSIFSQLKVGKSEDGFLLEKHPKLGPVEVSSAGIYLCGTAQAPKDVRDSISQAMGAAGKAGMLLSRGKIDKEPITAKVNAELCNGCGLCVKVCPFSAINMIPMEGKSRPVASVTTAACMGCGTCSAECQVKFAIEMPYFTDSQIKAQIDAALAEKPEEKVITFACNWCSYAGADQAGVEKLQYPPSSRVIRTMCSGRIGYTHISYAFEKGAGAVLVTGCRIGDCHYINANLQTEKRFAKWSQRIQNSLKIPPERLHLRWISAAEGKEFAAKMKEMDEVVKKYKAQKTASAGVAQ